MKNGLDVTLDSLAVHARKWTQDEWLDASVQFIKKRDFILDCLQFEELMGKNNSFKEQLRTIDQPSDESQATRLKAIRLSQSKRFIREWLDCEQLTG